MRSCFVVVNSPTLDRGPSVSERGEPGCGQTLVPEFAVEALDEAVLRWPAWWDEIEANPAAERPGLEDQRGELRSVVEAYDGGLAGHRNRGVQGLDNRTGRKSSGDLDARTNTAEVVDDRQRTKATTILEPIGNEIDVPALVGRVRWCRGDADLRGELSSLPDPQIQPFQTIKSVHPLYPDLPAFALQQNVETPISEPRPGLGKLSQPASQSLLRVGFAPLVVRAPLQLEEPTRPLNADRIPVPGLVDQLALARGLQSFFAKASLRIWRSRLRSATKPFSLRFSSRSCRSSRNSLELRPPNFLRQL